MNHNSQLTAITRAALPVPVRWMLSQGMVHGHVLDYGCGKCKHLNDTLLATMPLVKSVTSYDPFYHPKLDTSQRGKWDVVLCTYVLCTLPIEEERKILKTIQSLLLPNGVAYISVRNDEPVNGYGVSSKGTFQRKVEIPYLYALRKHSQYKIYLLTSSSELL
jgi:hypothetical protein